MTASLHALPETRVFHVFMLRNFFTNSVFLAWQRKKKGNNLLCWWQKAETFQQYAIAMASACQSRTKRTACLHLHINLSSMQQPLMLSLLFTLCLCSFTWSALWSCLRDDEDQLSYWKVHVLLESSFSAWFYTFLEQKKIEEGKPSVFV